MTETYTTTNQDLTLPVHAGAKRRFGFPQRIAALAALFILELVSISMWMDSRALWGYGRPAVRAVIAFAAFFLTFAFLKSKAGLQRISEEYVETPVRWGLLALHAGAMIGLIALTALQFSNDPAISLGLVRIGRWSLAA